MILTTILHCAHGRPTPPPPPLGHHPLESEHHEHILLCITELSSPAPCERRPKPTLLCQRMTGGAAKSLMRTSASHACFRAGYRIPQALGVRRAPEGEPNVDRVSNGKFSHSQCFVLHTSRKTRRRAGRANLCQLRKKHISTPKPVAWLRALWSRYARSAAKVSSATSRFVSPANRISFMACRASARNLDRGMLGFGG